MSRLLRQLSSSSLRRRGSDTPSLDVLVGDVGRSSVYQPRRSASSTKTGSIHTTPKQDGTFRVFLSAADDRIDAGTQATYLGPPLLFELDAPQPDFTSLELAARMALMFADEVYFSPLALYGQRPTWNHNSLRKSALTFLRTWDVQYRCDVLPWTGWFSISNKGEAKEFLSLMRALHDGSVECEVDEEWACFLRQKGVLRVDLMARFVYRPPAQ